MKTDRNESNVFTIREEEKKAPARHFTGMLFLYAALAALALLFHRAFLDGACFFLEKITDLIGRSNPYVFPGFTPGETAGTASIVFFAAVFVLVLILLGYLIYKFRLSALTAILFVLLAALAALLGLKVSLPAAAAAFMVLLLFRLLSRSSKVTTGSGKKRAPFWLLPVCLTAAVFLAALLVFPETKYRMPEKLQKIKTGIMTVLEEKRFGKENYPLPMGNFQKLGPFSPDYSTALMVTMSKPDSYYLRGFTGDSYVGNGWEDTASEKLWDFRDLFYWLREKGFFAQQLLAESARTFTYENAQDINLIRIENVGANSKYYYTPYELYEEPENSVLGFADQKIGDAKLAASGFYGSRDYSYNAVAGQVVNYPEIAARLLDTASFSEEQAEQKRLEGYYNEFVYDTYLDIPVGVRNALSQLLGKVDIKEGEKHADYSEARQNILYILNADYQYLAESGKTWDGIDLVYDFLQNQKSGYSVHFASAAAMMFRYYGIPSRYVEGYLVTPKDAERMEPDTPFEITQKSAHAWAEYYQDGVGWIPFETTPSYINVMGEAKNYQNISGVAGEAPMEEPEEEPEETETDSDQENAVDWLLVIRVILQIFILVMLCILAGMLIRLFVKRRRAKRLREDFAAEDTGRAVRSIFAYIMNILAVNGLSIRNISLFDYEKDIEEMFDGKTAVSYREIAAIRQAAVYSTHSPTEEDRKKLLSFLDELWNRVYTNGSLSARIAIRFIYFL